MGKKRRNAPAGQWEQALIDDYHDYRYREVLEPLYKQFQCWKAGELSHLDLMDAIHEVHKENQELWKLFTRKREWLVGAIQYDREWFEAWLARHPAPAGTRILPQELFATAQDEPEEEDGGYEPNES